jgi:hypothetical protein
VVTGATDRSRSIETLSGMVSPSACVITAGCFCGLPAPEGSPVTAYVIETHAPARQGWPSASHFVDALYHVVDGSPLLRIQAVKEETHARTMS